MTALPMFVESFLRFFHFSENINNYGILFVFDTLIRRNSKKQSWKINESNVDGIFHRQHFPGTKITEKCCMEWYGEERKNKRIFPFKKVKTKRASSRYYCIKMY